MKPSDIDDPNNVPERDRNDEEFVPGPLDDPSEANDENEPIEDPLDDDDDDDDEDRKIEREEGLE